MTKKNIPYKVVCPLLNAILLIRKYPPRKLQELHATLKNKINSSDVPLEIPSYIDFLINTFILDVDTLKKIIEKEDEEDHSLIYRDVYECIIGLYPPFGLDVICNDINSELFLEIMQANKSDRAMFEEFLNNLSSDDIEFPLVTKKGSKGNRTLRSLSSIEKLESILKKKIIGQDEAIESVIKNMKLIASELFSMGSLFFIGPTGVGKTALSKVVGENYSGNFYKINCAEYSSGHEYSKLIGATPGYIGYTDKSILAEMAETSSQWVILFDEIEKAHPRFMNFLLSLLDDGTVTDNNGRVLDFSKSIFIFTSNEGMSHVDYNKKLGFANKHITYVESQGDILKMVKKKFSPEFLNRIDNFIFFNPLTKDDAKKIAELELKNIPIRKTNTLLNYIIKNSYSEEYGARNIARFIKNDVAVKTAEALLSNKRPTRLGNMYSPRITKSGELQIITLPEKKKSV
jgi:ATP-dependent Clp protease ATP-binding subunit ClpA